MILFWLLIALALLDGAYYWLPDWITLPGAALGFISRALIMLSVIDVNDASYMQLPEFDPIVRYGPISPFLAPVWAALLAALLILLIRWLYKLIRHREGLGLGDAKLMALLAAWLGLPGALLAFFLGIVLGSVVAVVLLLTRSTKPSPTEWSATKLPLGTFLCIGGIISALWGQPIIAAYLHWAGF